MRRLSARGLVESMLGSPLALPPGLVQRWPGLGTARFRRGGWPPRIGGWLLGRRTVAAVTLGRTIWLARAAHADDAELLLHELRHVQQFESIRGFAWRYLWQSIRCGYRRNRYEEDARAYAAREVEREGGGA